MRGMINEKRGRIAVRSQDRKVQSALEELEPDSQGYLRFNKVEEALLALAESRRRSRFSTIGIVLLALGTLVFLAATFGLVYLVVDLRRDMKSMNGALVDSVTKKPVQTASSDLMLANGVLVPRVTTQGARRADEDGPQLPIVTAIKTVFFNMSTARSSKELAAIATLTIASTDGIGTIHLAVDGAVVVPSASAVGGKVVIYSTAIGDMVLNSTALTPAAESLTPETALQRAASGVFPNTGERPADQHLCFPGRPSARFPTVQSLKGLFGTNLRQLCSGLLFDD